MAQNKLLSLILVLILLVFFQEIQCIVGRHLMLDQKFDFQKLNSGRILATETGTFLDGKVNLYGVNTKAAADAIAQSPPSPPSVVVGAAGAPPPKNAEDFRPTTPGHSPGVGHSLHN